MYKSKYFKNHELLPKGFTDISVMDENLLITIDQIRELIGLPLTINNYASGGPRQWCGYRTPECTVGAPKSYHRKGMAVDLHCDHMSAEDMRELILKASELGHLPYLGRLEGNVSWVHADLGSRKDGKVYVFNA